MLSAMSAYAYMSALLMPMFLRRDMRMRSRAMRDAMLPIAAPDAVAAYALLSPPLPAPALRLYRCCTRYWLRHDDARHFSPLLRLFRRRCRRYASRR